MGSTSSGTSNRGFASMDPARQREIASKGGKSVPPEHRSFSRNHELASKAGRKGGEASHGGGRSKAAAATPTPPEVASVSSQAPTPPQQAKQPEPPLPKQ